MTTLTVTATQGGSTGNGMLLRVFVLTGAKPAAAQSGNSFTAQESITTAWTGSITNSANSSIYGAADAETLAASPTGSNATIIDNVGDATNSQSYITFKAVNLSAGTTTRGFTLSANASGPLCMAEILAATTLAEDGSAPAQVNTTGAGPLSTASFTPPPGSLLVAQVTSNGGAGVTTFSLSGGGLTWTEKAKQNASGGHYAGIWIADVPPQPGTSTIVVPPGLQSPMSFGVPLYAPSPAPQRPVLPSPFTWADSAVTVPTGTPASAAITYPGPVQAGDLLVVGCRLTSAAITVSDNQGNTWVEAFTSSQAVWVFYARAQASYLPGTLTITLGGGGGLLRSMAVDRFHVAPGLAVQVIGATQTSAPGTNGNFGGNVNDPGGQLLYGFVSSPSTGNASFYPGAANGVPAVIGAMGANATQSLFSEYVTPTAAGAAENMTWFASANIALRAIQVLFQAFPSTPGGTVIPPGLASPMVLAQPPRPATQAPPAPPPAPGPGYSPPTPPGRMSPMALALPLIFPASGSSSAPPVPPPAAGGPQPVQADSDRPWLKRQRVKWYRRGPALDSWYGSEIPAGVAAAYTAGWRMGGPADDPAADAPAEVTVDTDLPEASRLPDRGVRRRPNLGERLRGSNRPGRPVWTRDAVVSPAGGAFDHDRSERLVNSYRLPRPRWRSAREYPFPVVRRRE